MSAVETCVCVYSYERLCLVSESPNKCPVCVCVCVCVCGRAFACVCACVYVRSLATALSTEHDWMCKDRILEGYIKMAALHDVHLPYVLCQVLLDKQSRYELYIYIMLYIYICI